MDYPPITGYHSYILGKILEKYYPDSVVFKKSMGFENAKFKIIMRLFVLISDLLVFHLGVNLFCYYMFIQKKKNKNKKPDIINYYIILFLILINPLMIIIDHGHFQFNNVMHGFFMLIERMFLKKILDKTYIICRIYALGVLCITFAIFRFENIVEGLYVVHRLINPKFLSFDMDLSSLLNKYNMTIFYIAIIFTGPFQILFKNIINKLTKINLENMKLCIFENIFF